jgi:parallel beta-helix repeat protein
MSNGRLSQVVACGALFLLTPASACLARSGAVDFAVATVRREWAGLGMTLAASVMVLALAYVVLKRGRRILQWAFVRHLALVFIAGVLAQVLVQVLDNNSLTSGSRTKVVAYLGFLFLCAVNYIICRFRSKFTGGEALLVGILAGVLTNPLLFEMCGLARTVTVGRGAGSIAAAMKMARAGDTVYVPKGIYDESDIDMKDGVRLLGDGMGRTVIRGKPRNASWVIRAWAVKSRIEGITVEHVGAREERNPSGGIYVWKGNVAVVACEARNTSGSGICVKASDATVDGCTSTGNVVCGISVHCDRSNVSVKNCILKGNKQGGIDMYVTGRASVEGCTIEGNEDGIVVSGEGAVYTFVGNTVTGNRQKGIAAFRTGQVTVRNNTCRDNTKDAICIWEHVDKAVVIGNTCKGNRDDAIYLGADSATVSENTCEGNKGGIIVMDTGEAIVEKNRSIGSFAGSGIYGERVRKMVVRDNECVDNAVGGIWLPECSDAAVTGNKCTSNGEGGIDLGKTRKAVVTGNVLYRNEFNGINVAGNSAATVSDNTCQENEYCGVLVSGVRTRAELVTNTSIGNKRAGIWFEDGASGTVSGNTCSGNGWAGIGVRGAGTVPVLTANRCNDNGAWGIVTWAGAKLSGLPGDNTAERNFRGEVMEKE